MSGLRPLTAAAVTAVVALSALPGHSLADASHAGWPRISMLLMNKADRSRPLDARPGMDPFGGKDPKYSCNGIDPGGHCHAFLTSGKAREVKPGLRIHSELLGGHGDDTIHAGDLGDVIWGDYKPSGQPGSQHDQLFGGAGKDFIYVSHGLNDVDAGGGDDRVHAHFGHGIIDCGAGNDTLFVSHKTVKLYKISNCEHISYRLNAS